MPALSGMLPALELKKTEKTRKILGLECTLYQVTDRGQTFDVWAMSDSSLFPFQMLERRSHRLRFGQPTIEEQWPELLRKEALFPLEATLGNEAGKQDRLSFKIEKIEKREIKDRKLFEPPEGYQQLQPAQFR